MASSPLAFAPGLGWAWGMAFGFLALYALLALLAAERQAGGYLLRVEALGGRRLSPRHGHGERIAVQIARRLCLLAREAHRQIHRLIEVPGRGE